MGTSHVDRTDLIEVASDQGGVDADAGGADPPSDPMLRYALPAMMAAVALPVLVAGVRLAVAGWTPTYDDGFVVTRGFDVFTGRSPSLGQFSLAGEPGTTAAHSLGPMGYWMLAVPSRIGPDWLLPIWMSIVSGACLATSVWLARRRAGLGFALGTAIGLLLLVRALSPDALAAVWNPWVALAPLVLLAFLAWSIADGETWMLPIAVGVCSYVMQAHLTYVLPALGLLAACVAVAARGWVVERVRGRRSSDGAVRLDRAPVWRSPVLQAMVVGVVCWAMPVIEQFSGRSGNMTRLADASGGDRARAGSTAGQAAIAHTVGIPPNFLRPSLNALEAIREGLGEPSTAALLGGVAVLGLLLAVALLAVRRRDATVWSGSVVAGTLTLSTWIVASSMPTDRLLAAGYSFRWFAIAGLFVWLIVGLGATRAVLVTRPRGTLARRTSTWVQRVLAIGLVLAMSSALSATNPIETWSFEPAHGLGSALIARTEPGGRYLISNTGPFVLSFTPALAWQLRTHGRNPVMAGDAIRALGEGYGPKGAHCDGVVYLLAPGDRVPPDGELLRREDLGAAPLGVPADVRLYLGRDTSAVGRC